MTALVLIIFGLTTLGTGCGAGSASVLKDRQNFQSPRPTLNRYETDFKERQEFYKQALSRTTNPVQHPYVEMNKELSLMQSLLIDLKAIENRTEQRRTAFDQLAVGKVRFAKPDPDYQEYQRLNSSQDRDLKSLKDNLKQYKKRAASFDDLVRQYQVGSTPAGPMRQRAQNLLMEVERVLADMDRLLFSARDKVKRLDRYVDLGFRQRTGEALGVMEALAIKAKTRRTGFDQEHIAFERETRDSALVWRGPGIRTGERLETMSATLREMGVMHREFRSAASQIDKNPPVP